MGKVAICICLFCGACCLSPLSALVGVEYETGGFTGVGPYVQNHLLGVVKDKEKIRNTVGMCGETYKASKRNDFKYARADIIKAKKDIDLSLEITDLRDCEDCFSRLVSSKDELERVLADIIAFAKTLQFPEADYVKILKSLEDVQPCFFHFVNGVEEYCTRPTRQRDLLSSSRIKMVFWPNDRTSELVLLHVRKYVTQLQNFMKNKGLL